MSALIRCSLGAVLLAVCISAGPTPSPLNDTRPALAPAATAVAYLPPVEVRLRKVHLVRPDLIPYPIAFEVVC